MLQTQVAWWTLQENKRHNVVSESQNKQDLLRKERELRNTINYNMKQVEYWQNQLAELTRHNKVTESLSAGELKTKQDQARASLQNAQASLGQARAALANVGVNAMNAATNAKNAATNAYNARVGKYNAKVGAYNARTKRYETKANVGQTKAGTALIEEQAKTEAKRNKYYGTEHVLIPGVNASANVVRSVGSLKPKKNK
jgi:hypothetical protein